MDEATKTEIERLRDEDKRQNQRIEVLEQNVEVQRAVAVSVEKLAVNMEQMLVEQRDQGVRLKALEQEPAQHWGNFKRTIFNNLTGALTAAVAGGVIWAMVQYIK